MQWCVAGADLFPEAAPAVMSSTFIITFIISLIEMFEQKHRNTFEL